ncbi:MAG: hypothetical protein LBS60_13450 [Deltaproteobacteria bacterium]|nr:hypothetical protein [Deltaproteobacteria bacterium]
MERLKEPRAFQAIDSVLAAKPYGLSPDRQFRLDLGIVVKDARNGLCLANAIHQKSLSTILAKSPLTNVIWSRLGLALALAILTGQPTVTTDRR